MTPPASVEPVVLWRYPNCGQWSRGPVVLGHDKRAPDNVNYCAEGRWLPVAAFDEMEAKASAYPDAMALVRSLAKDAADVPALIARIAALEAALRRFADLGDESRYPYRPSRLDVPFEWYAKARAALKGEGA